MAETLAELSDGPIHLETAEAMLNLMGVVALRLPDSVTDEQVAVTPTIASAVVDAMFFALSFIAVTARALGSLEIEREALERIGDLTDAVDPDGT